MISIQRTHNTTIGTNNIGINNCSDWLNTIEPKYRFKHTRVHGFRHTHCSLLFEAGTPIQVVKDRLGHKNISTTMDIYTHVTKKSKEEVAQMFADYINF